jgi:DNA/RNA non-specific endonuclease
MVIYGTKKRRCATRSNSNTDDDSNNYESDDDNDDSDNNTDTSDVITSISDSINNRRTGSVGRRQRRYRFKEHTTVPEQYRSRNSLYHLSGYDRGHLAPAGDFFCNQIENSTDDTDILFLKQIEDTYNLFNISVQNSKMNLTIWSYSEYLLRKITRDTYYNDDVDSTVTTYIITGPLWLPQKQLSDKLYEYQYNAFGTPPTILSCLLNVCFSRTVGFFVSSICLLLIQ